MHFSNAWYWGSWIILLCSFPLKAHCTRLDYRLQLKKKRKTSLILLESEQKFICSPATPPCVDSSPPLQVMQVVREQIMRALTLKPNSLDQFKSRLQNLSYTEILKIRQSERMNQEDFQSRPILWVSQSIIRVMLQCKIHKCTLTHL